MIRLKEAASRAVTRRADWRSATPRPPAERPATPRPTSRRRASGTVLRKTALILCMLLIGALAALCIWPGIAHAMIFEMVSVGTGGIEGDSHSFSPSISADGRYVAFASDAGNLVPGDTNGTTDVFVRDRVDGTVERVSVATDGAQGEFASVGPSISADGRYVAFASDAGNLVPGDTNSCEDVFVHDRETGTTVRVSVGPGGIQGDGFSQRPAISADGRYVAFESEAANLVTDDANGHMMDIFTFDRVDGIVERVSVTTDGADADGPSAAASVSADGRYVAFESEAANLVPGDTNGWGDVFVRDRVAHTTERVSVDSAGAGGSAGSYGPSISADGRFVAFTWRTMVEWNGNTRPVGDIFVRDRVAGTTECLTAGPEGAFEDHTSGGPSISADGRYVSYMFVPEPTLLPNFLVVHDRPTGTTETVCLGNYASGPFPFSADGRYVACAAPMVMVQDAPRDTNGARDVYLADRLCNLLRGVDRYDTAIRISRAAFPESLRAGSGLVLAPGETFQEALCGAPLAAALGGPVLLTPGVGLNNAVRAEIQRLGPAEVVCIGLSDVVGGAVQAALPSAVVTVIREATVYEMSHEVAKTLSDRLIRTAVIGLDWTAIITRGDVFPDAVGVAPLACARMWPILLTGPSDHLDAHAAAALVDLSIGRAIKVGTYAKLPSEVIGLANLSGVDRYATNRNVAQWGQNVAGLSFAHLGIATGEKFPDGLAAGPFLAKDEGILLLSPLYGPLPAVIDAEIGANAAVVERISFLAMIEPVIRQVRALVP